LLRQVSQPRLRQAPKKSAKASITQPFPLHPHSQYPDC